MSSVLSAPYTLADNVVNKTLSLDLKSLTETVISFVAILIYSYVITRNIKTSLIAALVAVGVLFGLGLLMSFLTKP